MQFLLIVLLNIVMWVIFYLIMTLKIERSSSHFREKKLRQVMDEIMTEFNAASERNITILENRISVLRKLLEKTGDLKKIDFKESGSPEMDSGVGETTAEKTEIEAKKELINKTEKGIFKNGVDLKWIFTGAAECLARISAFILRKRDYESSIDNRHSVKTEESILIDEIVNQDNVIKKDMLSFQENIKGLSSYKNEMDLMAEKSRADSKMETLDEDEIYRMFETSDDRYSLIMEFFNKGFHVSEIAKYSGIPEGEVKLILNLQGN